MAAHIAVIRGAGKQGRAVTVVDEVQPCGFSGGADGQDRTGIVITGGDVVGIGRTLGGCGNRAAGEYRRIIHASHCHCYHAFVSEAVYVVNGIIKNIRAGEIGGGSIKQCSIYSIYENLALTLGLSDVLDCQKIAVVYIVVVFQHLDDHRDIFLGTGNVVNRHWRVVDRSDCNGDRSRVGVQRTVAHGKCEAVAAVVVRIRGVSESTAGTDARFAVGGAVGQSKSEGVPIGIGTAQLIFQTAVLGQSKDRAFRRRSIVGGLYRHAYCQDNRTAVVVVSGNCEGEVSVPLTGRAGEGSAIG